MPFLGVTGERTFWSVNIFPGVIIVSIPTKYRLVTSPFLIIVVSSMSSSSLGFVDRIFFLTCSMCPFSVDPILGMFFYQLDSFSWPLFQVDFLGFFDPC